ncbi:MAG: cytidylate kinase-like family protein [Eubacterium sp.]|nr:cytidylate kinase-like family protein [Eubacterium sp.]
MDNKFVITISREFGSMGRPIAMKLAELLNIRFYDRDIVEQTAQNLGVPVSTIKENEESIKNKFFNMTLPLGNDATEQQDMIFNEQVKIIRDFADKGSCIIVGRCADYVFGNDKNAFKVHVYAPYEARLRNCVDILRLDRETAKKTIKKVDKARKAYHMYYAGYAPGDPSNLDLLINSEVFGINGTAEALAKLMKVRFNLEE